MQLISDTGSVAPDLKIYTLLIAIGMGFVLSLVLRYHFLRLGKASSNRRDIGNILPFIVMTIVLIISIVKSSLALSLGLVGSLSVIRFRTAIKEPEELAYLFMAIAIGLGLGANQLMLTTVTTLTILSITAVFSLMYSRPNSMDGSYLLSVEWDAKENAIEEVLALVRGHARSVEMKKFQKETDQGVLLVSFYPSKKFALQDFQADINQTFPSIRYTLLDNSHLYGL